MAKRYNITTKRVGNDDYKSYPNVGKLVYFPASHGKDEGFILELNMFPDTKFYVFDDKPRDQKQKSSYQERQTQPALSEPVDPDSMDFPEGDINLEDIPY